MSLTSPTPDEAQKLKATFEDISVQVSSFNMIINVPAEKFAAWDTYARKYMVESYFGITGFTDAIFVRDYQCPRVFIGPKWFWDSNCKIVEVPGDIPQLCQEGHQTSGLAAAPINHTPFDEVHQDTQAFPVDDSLQVYTYEHRNDMNANSATQVDDDVHGSVQSPDSNASDATSGNARVTGVSPQLLTASPTGRIPRPPNCWIIFRSHLHSSVAKDNPTLSNNEHSQIIARMWADAPLETRIRYQDLAMEAKVKHKEMYPGYRYGPRKPGEKKHRMTKKKRAALDRARILNETNPSIHLPTQRVIGADLQGGSPSPGPLPIGLRSGPIAAVAYHAHLADNPNLHTEEGQRGANVAAAAALGFHFPAPDTETSFDESFLRIGEFDEYGSRRATASAPHYSDEGQVGIAQDVDGLYFIADQDNSFSTDTMRTDITRYIHSQVRDFTSNFVWPGYNLEN